VLRKSNFALFLLFGLVACSSSHSLSHEELQSEFRASISLSSETEVFLSHLEGHTYSPSFVQGHLEYLQKQGSEMESKLGGASAEGRDVESLGALRKGTGELMQVFDDLHAHTVDGQTQARSISHLDSIRKHLEADMPR
jgi:hypothetical protein